MAHDDDIETERDTVPLPDTEIQSSEAPPAPGVLSAEPEPDDEYLEVPEDHRRRPSDPHSRTIRLNTYRASGRSKGLMAAAVVGVLVVGGAVAATVGGGSGKGPDKSAAPTAGLVGQQISSSTDGVYASNPTGATSGSPWVWQTGQSTAKYPGASTGSAAAPGAPKPTGSASGPGSQSSGPGTPQHSASAPGVPSGAQPSSSAGAPATAPSAPPPATVTLVAGPGCPGLPGSGGYSAVGSGASSGWGSNGSGGWSGDGCTGAMQSMPMTGDSSNGPNRAVWSFGSGTTGFASCVVSVYVPWDGKATDTGGTAAGYQVAEGTADTTVANFTVDQNTTHGQWATLGTVKVNGDSVKLRLLDHGVDYPAGWRYGVAAAKVQCTA